MLARSPTIKQTLHSIYTSHAPSRVHEVMFELDIEWCLFNASPSYLTDGHTCVMFEMGVDVKQPPPVVNPYSIVRTSYYNTFKDCFKMFNCSQETLQQINDGDPYPNPYSPFFHFQMKFQEFKQERQDKDWMSTRCPKLLLKKWKVLWVNIANTGYVAPIIRVYKYEKTGEEVFPNRQIHSILYDQETVRTAMGYWKELAIKALPDEPPCSMGFQLNGLISSDPPRKNHKPLLNLDFSGSLLRAPTHSRQSETFVLLNKKDIYGDHFVNQSLLNQAQLMSVDSEALNYRQKDRNKVYYGNIVQEDNEGSPELSEEDDPLEDYHEQERFQDKADSSEEEDESSNEEDNFLRRLYKNKLKGVSVRKAIQPHQTANNGSAMIAEEEPQRRLVSTRQKSEHDVDSPTRAAIKMDELSDSPELSD